MRLCNAALDRVRPWISVPGYDRRKVRSGIVHLGLGAFHRAHQARSIEQVLAGGDLRWGITGVCMRSARVRNRLRPQDGLFTLIERDDGAETATVVGSIIEVLDASADCRDVASALASAETHLVTLTITEKGYRLDPVSGELLWSDSGVIADLHSLARPRTAVGMIVAGLERRRKAGLAPFTTISCDNLPENGSRLRRAVLALAEGHDPALARWIEREAAFPNSMVDRIVPATTAVDLIDFTARTELVDEGLVKTEPFHQWVIEDRFCGASPDLRGAGVVMATDIRPWELAKLRMLNGAHSAIAYLGGLAGFACVHNFVADGQCAQFVNDLWDEIAPTIDPPAGLDLRSYRILLMSRFANSTLRHSLPQIAMDGSQKLPQRLFAPLAERARRGQQSDALILAIAAWIRWLAGQLDNGAPHAIDDPLADRLRHALSRATTARERVSAMIALAGIMPAELQHWPAFERQAAEALQRIEQHGARQAIAMHLADRSEHRS